MENLGMDVDNDEAHPEVSLVHPFNSQPKMDRSVTHLANDSDSGSERDHSLNEVNGACSDDEPDYCGDESDSGGENDQCSNAGWADAMQKVLKMQKPIKKKTIVLSKAKRLSEVKLKQDGDNEEDNTPQTDEQRKAQEHKLCGREKPNVLDKDKEKTLSKIASKGVIQLFNAANSHIKNQNIKSEDNADGPGKSAKMNAMNKRSFLNMLIGDERNHSINNEVPYEIKEEEEEDYEEDEKEPTNEWSVLKENYLTGVKLKNWDKPQTTQ